MIRIVTIALTSLLLSGSGCAQKQGLLEPTAFEKLLRENAEVQLIDVRTRREFDEGRIEHAILIDYYRKDFEMKISRLDKNRPVAVYCTIGVRSSEAFRILRQAGFKTVYDLKGGITNWVRQGYAIAVH